MCQIAIGLQLLGAAALEFFDASLRADVIHTFADGLMRLRVK
jgi:hypothetical protein